MRLDIAKEEKTHVGELQTLLLRLDAERRGNWRQAKKRCRGSPRNRLAKGCFSPI